MTPPLAVKEGWKPIETAPKDRLIDVWIRDGSGAGIRWADCYYDSICDEWRTSRPSGHLVTVKARFVTHWMSPPADPTATLPTFPNTGGPAEEEIQQMAAKLYCQRGWGNLRGKGREALTHHSSIRAFDNCVRDIRAIHKLLTEKGEKT